MLRQFRGLLNKPGRLDWNVKILDRYEHGRGVTKYLARYVRGGPIGNSRLVSLRDGQVSFRYRDNRAADGESGRGPSKVLPLPTGEFLRRVLEHVPPPGMHTVRSWGLYASSRRGDLARARAALGQPAPAALPVRVRWQDVLRRIGGDAATRCSVCGAELVTWGEFRRGQSPPSLAAWPGSRSTKLHRRGRFAPRSRPAESLGVPPPFAAAVQQQIEADKRARFLVSP